MTTKFKLNDLSNQSDAVWASCDVAEIEAFQTSRLLPLLRDKEDLSSLNTELIDLANCVDEELLLSHLRANVLRAFDWPKQAKVLEIGCQAGAITRFLSEQDLHIDAIEPDRSLAQLAALRTKPFSDVRIIAEPFNQLDFQSATYDVIVLTGITDCSLALSGKVGISFEQALVEFLSSCKQLLSTNGKIFLIADNSQGIKYSFGAIDERTLKPYSGYQCLEQRDGKQTLNLSQWQQLIKRLELESFNEYYLFPDYRFAKVLLGREYVEDNPYAFQHLEGLPSVDYYHPLDIGISEFLIYQTLTTNGRLGEFANSFLFVLHNDESQLKDNPDFVHFPDYKRHQNYLALVKKESFQSIVNRQRFGQEKGIPSGGFEQDFQAEEFVPGIQLSTLWVRHILHDPEGVKFEQYLRDYFEFVKKLESGVVQGMNIDAIANNIVVDEQGNYHLIDREWQLLDEKIDSPFVFYRAMVHFALRNDVIFHHFKWFHSLFTLSDFLKYCFKAIGIDAKIGDLEQMRYKDCTFLSSVLKNSSGYDLSDTFGQTQASTKAITFISWRFTDEFDYDSSRKTICKPKAGHDLQQLTFGLPVDKNIACFRFFPFQHLKSQIAGYFSIDSIKLKQIDQFDQQRTLWNLDSSDEVNQANVHPGVFYAHEDDSSVFMFRSNNTFLEFELPECDLNNTQQLRIEILFRLKQSHDYEIARNQYVLVQQAMNEKLMLREDEFKSLNKELKKIKSELTQVQVSRVWRLLVAYRDTFKITGYPPKNFIGKVGQLIKRFKRSG